MFVNTVNVAILQLSYGLASIFVNRHFLTAWGIYKMLYMYIGCIYLVQDIMGIYTLWPQLLNCQMQAMAT